MHLDSYSEHLHLVPLHPGGRHLTEDHHAERAEKQRELATWRIQEIMAGDEPLRNIMSSKLAHRGLDLDNLFDEAIEELREAFSLNPSAIKDASADAFRIEQERRAKIKASAKAAARRAGLQVDEDEHSLAPEPRRRVKEVEPE